MNLNICASHFFSNVDLDIYLNYKLKHHQNHALRPGNMVIIDQPHLQKGSLSSQPINNLGDNSSPPISKSGWWACLIEFCCSSSEKWEKSKEKEKSSSCIGCDCKGNYDYNCLSGCDNNGEDSVGCCDFGGCDCGGCDCGGCDCGGCDSGGC